MNIVEYQCRGSVYAVIGRISMIQISIHGISMHRGQVMRIFSGYCGILMQRVCLMDILRKYYGILIQGVV